MRYNDVDTVSFRALNGKSYSVKDLRLIPSHTIRKSVECNAANTLDEVASRDDVYGSYAEDQAFRIFEANRTQIFDARLDMAKIKRLEVPV